MDTLSAFFKLCFIAHWMHVFMCLVTISNCHVSRVHCIISNSPLEVDFHSKKKCLCMRYIRINIHVHLRVRNRVVLFSSILLSFFLATTMTTSTLVKYRSPGFNRMCCFFFNYCLYLFLLLCLCHLLLIPPSHINF